MKITLIGIGLMNGSLSKDIRKIYPNCFIQGFSRNDSTIETAIKLGLIQKKCNINQISDSDFIFISIPVEAIEQKLSEVLNNISKNTLVIDFGSTKNSICMSVRNHPNRSNYLAAHPIAGTEHSGPESAIEGLYSNKIIIFCEENLTNGELLKKANDLFSKLKMKIRKMNPVFHDKQIAFVSHLSHISSFMLGKTVLDIETDEKNIFDLAGSGFESTVRLAKSSPEMWVPIFFKNKHNILDSLNHYINNLEMFKDMIEKDDFERLNQELNQINRIKKILNK